MTLNICGSVLVQGLYNIVFVCLNACYFWGIAFNMGTSLTYNHISKIGLDHHQILDEDGFVGDVRARSSDIQDTLDQYDSPR